MKRRGSYETGMIFLLSIAFGVVFFDRNATSYLGPYLVSDLGLSNTQLGGISSGFSAAWAIAGLLGGRLSDALGKRKPLLLVMFVIFSLCSFMTGLAGSFAVLLLSRILMGLSEGPILPVAQSLVALESSDSRRGLNMGFMQNFGSNLLGSFVAPILLVWLAERYGWRNTFFIAGAPGLVLAALIWRYIREPVTHEMKTAAHPAAAVRAAGADGAHGGPDSARAAGTHGAVGATSAPADARMSVIEMFKYRNLWLSVLMCICMVPWMILAWVFLPQYYANVRHIAPAQASYLMGVLGISAAVFSFIVPGLSDKLGRKPVMIAFSAIGVLVPLAVLYYSGSLVTLSVLIFIGWSASGVMPLIMGTVPSETIPVRYIATTLGIVMGLGELIGGAVTPTLAGMAADTYGLGATLLIEAGLALTTAVLAMFLVETAPVKVGQQAAAAAAAQPAS